MLTGSSHGAGWLFLHRPELLQALYDALPDRVKSRVLVAKKVDSIAVHTDGVSVKCIDGTTERGSIVVGADGVHSRVRACLCKLESEAGIGPADDEFVSTYRCMYGSVGKIPGLEIGPEWDLHGSGVAMQLFGTAEKSWFLFYDKLLQSTQERTTYSEEDMERVALQFADVYVTDKVRFKDVWRVRDWVMLADLPEGIRTRWSGDRIVLVGDAASKQTPNIGQGWNCGVQDVVVLTNQLQSLLQSKSTSIISPNDLKTVFERYRGTRLPDLEACVKAAAGATRAVAWDTWSAWLQDRFITPWTDGSKQAFRQAFGAIVSKGRILEFVPERNRIAGVVPWEYASKSKD